MLRTMFLALVLAQAAIGSASATCAGADPAIVSVTVGGVTPDAGMNRYHLTGKVVNAGSAQQANNVLQFVDIYQGSEKLDAKAIPPLGPGQSYAFSYDSLRSRDAGKGTTTLNFVLDMRQPSSPGAQNCSPGNDRYTLTF